MKDLLQKKIKVKPNLNVYSYSDIHQ